MCKNCNDTGFVMNTNEYGKQIPAPCGCRPMLACDGCGTLLQGEVSLGTSQETQREAYKSLMKLAARSAWRVGPFGKTKDYCEKCAEAAANP